MPSTQPPLRVLLQGGGYDAIPVFVLEVSGATFEKITPIHTRMTITGATGAPIGGNYVAFAADAGLSNERILTAGSSIEIRTDATTITINAITNAGASSAGLAGTGSFYAVWSADPLLSNEKLITAGSSVTTHTDATAIYINAITNASASSAGLAGTGSFYAVWSSDPLLSNEKVITAGSSVTTHTDATAIYINAITSAGASSAGLAGTGSFYAVWSADPLLSNEKVITAGSSVTTHTDATAIYINAITSGVANTGGVVQTGSTNFLAWYKAVDTIVDDSPLYMNTGAGVASLNVEILTSNAASAVDGDVWIQSSANVLYLFARSNNANYFVAMAT